MNENESNELKIYEVTNKATGQKRYSVSTNAQDACQRACWPIGDCFVYEQKPKRRPMSHDRPLTLYKIPCRLCPYQYSECVNPPGEQCPCQSDTTDLNDWQKQVSKAYQCPHVGHQLQRQDYDLAQKWVTIEQAINELSPRCPPLPSNPQEPTCQTSVYPLNLGLFHKRS